MMDNEYWKQVSNYLNYEVSNLGRFRSIKNGIKIINGFYNKKGYSLVSIRQGNIKKNIFLHRLVAIAFIPNPMSKSQVNHISGNKSDNSIYNLEWATPAENVSHSYKVLKRNGASTGKFGKHHHSSKSVIQLNEREEIVCTYESITDAAKKNSWSHSNLSKCLNGNSASAYGYFWKFLKTQ